MINDIEQLKKDYSVFEGEYLILQKEIYDFVDKIRKEHCQNVDISDIKQRPNNKLKDLDSILNNIKVGKKSYEFFSCLFDIRDISGVRITCHCKEDLDNFITLLEGELRQNYSNVRVDDKNKNDKDGSSYRAVHIDFSKKVYKNGKEVDIFCEIQIRTVMGDAWAVQSHKYDYKSKGKGESHILTNSVSKIMNGCEDLWSLVREKSPKKSDSELSKSVLKIEKQTENDLHVVKTNLIQITKNKEWFNVHEQKAMIGLKELKINTFMEVKVIVHDFDIDITNKNLRDFARDSTIDTFGWPVGIFLDDGKEHSPKSDPDGIHAEISINNADWYLVDGKRTSYDYWAIKRDGSFYLTQSLFEDLHNEGLIFFNVRITRITELFFYIKNLYSFLGVPKNNNIDISVKHVGLEGRILSAASSNRELYRKYKTDTDVFSCPIIRTSLAEIDFNIISVVDKVTKPLFEQFDFFELDKKVLSEIVVNYVKGKIV